METMSKSRLKRKIRDLCITKNVKMKNNGTSHAFSLHFPFRRDQNPSSKVNLKISKMCENIIIQLYAIKDSALKQIKIFEL